MGQNIDIIILEWSLPNPLSLLSQVIYKLFELIQFVIIRSNFYLNNIF